MRISTADLARRLKGCQKPLVPFAHDNQNEGRKRYPRVTHELSEEQLRKIEEAIGDGSDFPKATDDPYVNFVVDCLVSFEPFERPSFAELRQSYVEEIATAREEGLD